MAIGTAIAIGATLGLAGQGFLFNYTKDQYEVKVSELEGLLARLKEHLSRLQELRSQLPQFWEDDTAQKTGEALDKTIKQVIDAMNLSENLLSTYKTVIESLGGSKETLSELITDALGVLSAND